MLDVRAELLSSSLDPTELLESLCEDTKHCSPEVLRGTVRRELLESKVADRLCVQLYNTGPCPEYLGIIDGSVL